MTRVLTDAAQAAPDAAGKPMLGQPYGRDAAVPLLERLRDPRYIGQEGMRQEAAARIEQLEAAFREICDFPYIGAQASAKIWGIARAALAGKEGT